jgi:hypothetical protein
LCKIHHQQKTVGALLVRVVSHDDDPGAPPGTLEWTLPSGVTCRTHPAVAAPAPIGTTGPGGDPAVVAAAEHVAGQQTRWETWRREHLEGHDPDDQTPTDDWAGAAWQHSRQQAARARADDAARAAAATR